VYVSGSHAYVADRYDGLRIIDVSDPTAPVEVGFYDTGDEARGVYVSGSHAYVADWLDGLRIIDVSDPTAPVEVGFYDTGEWARGVYVSGSHAYVADDYDGLRIIDVSDPTAPVEVGFYDTGGYARGVYVSGNHAYVADGVDGLYIIRNDLITGISEEGQPLPRAFVLKQNYPNPFNPVTTIEFSLPHASRITLYVYDVAGRMVKTLVNGNLPAGNHTVKWDGTGEAGQPVGSGVYLYRLTVGQASLSNVQTRKMVLLR
ncbi:MAG: T9SS C-terminal target domain-containing protein, partial [Calditrichaeota bacterium]